MENKVEKTTHNLRIEDNSGGVMIIDRYKKSFGVYATGTCVLMPNGIKALTGFLEEGK